MKQTLSVLPGLSKMFGVTQKHYARAKRARKALDRDFTSEELMTRMSAWALEVLRAARVDTQVKGHVYRKEPCIYVGNHVSYLDILVLAAYAPAVFIAKSEISKWPFLGKVARFGGTVFVERESQSSRKRSLDGVKTTVFGKKQSVALFPSGTTSVDETIPWRQGIFRFAEDHGLVIQPVALIYKPLKRAAFIDKDMLIPHIFKLIWEGSVKCELIFGEPEKITSSGAQSEKMQSWVKQQLKEHAS